MPSRKELLLNDETLKRLEAEYREQYQRYEQALAEKHPEAVTIALELTLRGRLVADWWDRLLRQE